MNILYSSHGGRVKNSTKKHSTTVEIAPPAAGDIAVDEVADFGFLFPPDSDASAYLDDSSVADLDTLGNLMVPAEDEGTRATPDGTIPPVVTYWGQFLDHELTARTDRETEFSKIEKPEPIVSASGIEQKLKNARTPRFDLDSVYGGVPLGQDVTPDIVQIISGMRHPKHPEKMRVGTAFGDDPRAKPLPDGLDPHRDLPRFGQVEEQIRTAFLNVVEAELEPSEFEKVKTGLNGRALIGDMRNDENLIVAQFHLSFLRFHNKVIDFLTENQTGWVPDFASAQTLTRLHYQYLIVNGYLKNICDPEVLKTVLETRAKHFFDFRNAFNARNPETSLGRAIPLEFSGAAFRFGHTMVRDAYDYNSNFGRGEGGQDTAPFDQIFAFTGGGGFFGLPKLPENWVIDWSRFLGTDPKDDSDGFPARTARSIDTSLAPPLGAMVNEGDGLPDNDVKDMFRHLARRNLRRGLSLRLPTGQALHRHLKSIGAVTSDPITDVATLLDGHNPALQEHLRTSTSKLSERTPLWFYCLAEAEATGGVKLGEVGSWIVASTFVGVLLDDPTSAFSIGFDPKNSPLRLNGAPIDTLETWMKFARVLE